MMLGKYCASTVGEYLGAVRKPSPAVPVESASPDL